MEYFSHSSVSDLPIEIERALAECNRLIERPSSLSRKAIVRLASRSVGQLDSFVQCGNMLAEHSHDATEVGLRSGCCLQFTFIQASQLSFYLSCILQGRRTLGF
jgi:hypothetical protein